MNKLNLYNNSAELGALLTLIKNKKAQHNTPWNVRHNGVFDRAGKLVLEFEALSNNKQLINWTVDYANGD